MENQMESSMEYRMEELLPIVAGLAEKYTANESTSISYERAEQLMEAVLYCIKQCNNQCNKRKQLLSKEGLSAAAAYKQGYEYLIEISKRTQQLYNEMIIDFNSYGNENYHATVTLAIPEFFRRYDARFAPQETLITMDYPTIRPITDCGGIDAISKYVEYIACEQRFLRALPAAYICEVLYQFQADYRKQFYNICRVVLRHVLGKMLMVMLSEMPLQETKMQKEAWEATRKVIRECNYERMSQCILAQDKQWLVETFSQLLEKLIQEKYHADKQLEEYLRADLKDFAAELWFATQNDSVQRVVGMLK